MARAGLGQQRVGGPVAADRLWLCASLLTAQYLFFFSSMSVRGDFFVKQC